MHLEALVVVILQFSSEERRLEMHRGLLVLLLSVVVLRSCKAQACTNFDIRLVSGPLPSEGRVEMCHNAAWGTVCDDSWDNSDAAVVCRQLGYSADGAASLGLATYGPGTGLILLDEVECRGTEERLIDCSSRTLGLHNCGHSEDAGVRCRVCVDGDMRLEGGSTEREGRVEVCSSGQWGTVCDDFWNIPDASVVCKQLGFSKFGAEPTFRASFGAGIGAIVLDDVGCLGNETSIFDCSHATSENCNHDEDAGVRCAPLVCHDGDLRFVGGATSDQGRLEVCFGEVWGTICDDRFGVEDANVVCRQFNYTAFTSRILRFGPAADTVPIFIENADCTGSEARLVDCPYDRNPQDCNHYEDIGIWCQTTAECNEGDVRLVNGNNEMEGRIEVCVNGAWGTVCDDSWSVEDSSVACGQLGFSKLNSSALGLAHFGEGNISINMDSVQCTGSEVRLIDCPFDRHTSDCLHHEDAGVQCQPPPCSNGDIRLVDGASKSEGRVEMCWNEEWGTVCDDSWGHPDAEVVCRQLGYTLPSSAIMDFSRAFFGSGSGSIWLDGVDCQGDESTLISCPRQAQRPVGSHNCYHYEDAGVRCGECVENSVRLSGGRVPHEGRVEVCLSGQWGMVCDDGWSTSDARVVCRQLGFSQDGVELLYQTTFGDAVIPFVMDNVFCTGGELALTQCNYLGATQIRSTCSPSEDAGLRCRPMLPGPPVSIALDISTVLTVTWTPPAPQSSPILRYNVSCNPTTSVGPTLMFLSGDNSTLSTSFDGVVPDTLYLCCVAAINSAGNGAARCSTVRTSEAPPTAAPRSVNAYSISSTALTISWNTPSPQNSNGQIRNYHYHVTEAETGTVRDGFTNSQTVTVTGLHPYYNYQCKVAAITVGQGPYSNPVTVRTFTAVPTSAPDNISATTLSPTSISLSWSLPASASHNGPLTGYSIRVIDAIRYEVTTVTGNGPSLSTHIVTGLYPYTQYLCSVAMSNVNGTGPFSQTVLAETSETVPTAAPRNVRAGTPSTTSLRLTWSPPPPDQQNGEIRHYSVRVTGTDTDVSTTATGLSITVPSLHPYYLYQYSVAAVTVGTGPYSVPDTVRMPPDVPSGHPTNFRSTQVTATSVALAWSAPPTDQHNGVITNYDVRVTREGFPPTFITTTSNLLETTINPLVPFTTYFFVVAARTVVGRGPFSTALTIITSSGPPAPPNNLAVNALSATSLRLTWEAPAAEHRNGVITKYVIEVTEQDTGVEIQRNTSSLSLMLSLLHPYYTYRCRVAAFTISLGFFTATVSERTLQDVPSGYPQNTVATVLSPSSISLSWHPPLLPERNGVITSYRIDFTNIEAGTHTFHTTTALSLLLPARPYTSYSLFVAASTEVGLGPYSVATTIRTPESAPTHVPRSISYEALGATSFLLRWLPPPEEHHNGIIREYQANAVEEASGRIFTLTTPGNTTEVVFEDLHPFHLYNCTVAAITVDHGPFSATIGVMTDEAAPGTSPPNIRAFPLSSTSLSITWDELPEDQKNGIIRGYDVVVSLEAGEVIVDMLSSDSRRSVNIFNLEAHTIYRCRVRAHTVVPGPYSTEVQVQTPEDTPSGTPELLTLIPSNPRTLVLSWQPPAERERNGVILTYTVNITDVLSGAASLFNTSATTYTANNLHPYYVYHCSVAASTQEGRGPFSYRVPVEMPEAAPSSAPRDVSAEVLGSTLTRLTWNAPLPVDQNGMIRQYHISVTEINTTREFTLISESQQYDLDFLLPHHTYQFSIAAVTVAAGPFSIPRTFVTAEEAPGTPHNFTIAIINSHSLTLSWGAPKETNGIITGYVIFCNTTGQDVVHSSGTLSTSTSTQLGSLHPYYSYLCVVAAETSVGRGPPAYKGVQMPQDVPTAPPRELAGEPAHSRELRLSWIAPEFTEQNGILTFYLLRCREVETGEIRNEMISAVNSFAVLRSLHPNYNYQCSITAATVVGSGPRSVASHIQMPEDVPTSPPLEFTKASLSPLSLTWQAPSIGNQNGALTGYTLRVSEGARDNVYMLETLSPSYTNASLLKFTNYTFAVAAETAVGVGPFTDPIAVTTPAGVPTTTPSVGMVTRISATAIQISWEPLSRKQSQGIVNEYLIKYRPTELNRRGRRNIDDLETVVTVTGSTSEYTLEGLDPRRQYTIAVAASTSAGHGNYSEELFVGYFENMPFQLHLTSEAIVCREWLIDGITEKERDIADDVTKQLALEKFCNCDITDAYIADTRLICNQATHKSMVFHGRMITTPTHTSTELLTELQDWLQIGPLLTIRGIQLRVLPCRVEVTTPENLDCVSLDFTPTKSSDKLPSKIPEKTPEVAGSGGGGGVPIPIVAGAVIGGVVLILIVLAIASIVVVRRKRRKQRAVQLGHDIILNITPNEQCLSEGTYSEPDSKPGMTESHLYDSIPADYEQYKRGAEAPPSYHTVIRQAHNPLAACPSHEMEYDYAQPHTNTIIGSSLHHSAHYPLPARPSGEVASDYAQLNESTLLEDSSYHHLRHNPSNTSMPNPYDALPHHPPGYAVPRHVEPPSKPSEQGSGGLTEEMSKGGAQGVGLEEHEQDDYMEMKSHSPT